MEKARFVRTTVEGNICWGVIEGDVVYRLDGSPLGKWTRGEPIGNPENLLGEFPKDEELKTYGNTIRRGLVLRAVDAHLMVADKALAA